MKILHLTFHKGCELELEYAFKTLGHEITAMRFDDGETEPFGTPYVQSKMYEITHDRAQKSWEKYRDFYYSFDAIVTSDTCPVSRTFLQNNWEKPLLIWVCNRFDYAISPENLDPEYYHLLRDIPNRPNVRIFGYTQVENLYAKQIKNVDIGELVIKPIGKNVFSENFTKTYDDGNETFFVPMHHNETKLMNLSEKSTAIGFHNECKHFDHASELLKYKGIISIPHAWSTITFFEIMQLGIVTFIPTHRFLLELFKTGDWWFQPPFHISYPDSIIYSESYCPEHSELFVFFDSWIDLVGKINTIDFEEKTRTILAFARNHEREMMARWCSVTKDLIVA
jgi:hypothetical protein